MAPTYVYKTESNVIALVVVITSVCAPLGRDVL